MGSMQKKCRKKEKKKSKWSKRKTSKIQLIYECEKSAEEEQPASLHSYKDHRNKEFNKEHIKMQKIEHIVNCGTCSSFSLLNLSHTCTAIGVSNISAVPTSINDYFMCISNISCIHEHKQQIIKHHFQTQFWHTGATLKPWWSWYVPLIKVYLVERRNGRTKKKGRKIKSR